MLLLSQVSEFFLRFFKALTIELSISFTILVIVSPQKISTYTSLEPINVILIGKKKPKKQNNETSLQT